MATAIDLKIQELVSQYGYDAQVLHEFATFVRSQPKSRTKPKTLSREELRDSVAKAFGCQNYQELKTDKIFKLAIANRGFNLQATSTWSTLYQEWVQISDAERKEKIASLENKAPLTKDELKQAVIQAFGCKDYSSLKKHSAFKLATAGRNLDFRLTDTWLVLYREWVAVPRNERNEVGETCINGIDIFKNFRPWEVFDLDSKVATSDDINAAFRRLAKQHHPDHGGKREVFERLQKMRDSLLAFR